MLCSTPCTKSPTPSRVRRDRIERRDHAGRRQRAAGEPGEPVGREQQQPGGEHERAVSADTPQVLSTLAVPSVTTTDTARAQHDVDPEQRPGREERRRARGRRDTRCSRRGRRASAASSTRSHCAVSVADDDRHAGRRSRPAARRRRTIPSAIATKNSSAAQRVVLEHHLPDAAQVEVHEAQRRPTTRTALPTTPAVLFIDASVDCAPASSARRTAAEWPRR